MHQSWRGTHRALGRGEAEREGPGLPGDGKEGAAKQQQSQEAVSRGEP